LDVAISLCCGLLCNMPCAPRRRSASCAGLSNLCLRALMNNPGLISAPYLLSTVNFTASNWSLWRAACLVRRNAPQVNRVADSVVGRQCTFSTHRWLASAHDVSSVSLSSVNWWSERLYNATGFMYTNRRNRILTELAGIACRFSPGTILNLTDLNLNLKNLNGI